jgi:isoquinoline 1-oxidoreductase beta subunit
MSDVVKVSRRDFVKLSSAASVGLVLAAQMPSVLGSETKGTAAAELGPFVQIERDGHVTIWVAKSDMGQGVRTALPMIVAEELDADWTMVRIRQADLDRKYGRQGTGGSCRIRTSW